MYKVELDITDNFRRGIYFFLDFSNRDRLKFSRFLLVIITYYYDPYIPQTLAFSRKDQE